MRLRRFVVPAVFTIVFVVLTVGSYSRMSPTWDEPLHLFPGYAALHGEYRFGISAHPILLRLWLALPLLASPDLVLQHSEAWRRGLLYPVSLQFFFQDNDGGRLINRARFMNVILGVMLGLILFAWARRLFGTIAASLVLVLYTFEPNILAHSSLVTTDLGVTLFIFSACWFLWRTCDRLSPGNVASLALASSLTLCSKLSGLILLPMVGLLLAWKSLLPGEWRVTGDRQPIVSRKGKVFVSLGLMVSILLTFWLVLWSSYRFRYEYNPPGSGLGDEVNSKILQQVKPELRRAVESFDRLRLLPRAYTHGFRDQLGELQRERYLAGRFSDKKIPGFFTAIFLLKTPLAIILAIAGGLLLLARRQAFLRQPWPFILVPAAVYGAAIAVNPVNTGVRHILPLYPFLLLIAGLAIKAALGTRRGRIAILLGLLLLAADFAVIYPDYLASFNLAAGGPGRGEHWALDSNLDWGQGLKGLKEWMDENRVDRVNLCYFGVVPAEYYGINSVALPGTRGYANERPLLPGYVAVSLTNLYAFHQGRALREFYLPLRRMRPMAVIRRSINVYWVERPWWTPGSG